MTPEWFGGEAATSRPAAPVARRGVGALDLMRDGASGLVVAAISLAYCISFAGLIFSGPLGDGFALGLNMILIGAGISGVFNALFTSLPRTIAGPDTPTVAVLSALALSVAAAVGQGESPPDVVTAALLAICAAVILSGVFLFGLGLVRLGGAVRFIPFSVIAGFLAASGLLLIAGGLRVAVQAPVSFARLESLLALDPAGQRNLSIAVAFAVAVFVLRLRLRQIVILPLAILAATLAVHVHLGIGGTQVSAAGDGGWFLAAPSSYGLFFPLAHPGDVLAVLPVLADSFGEIAAVAVVTAIAIILNTSAVEAIWKTNADLEREFRVSGAANVIAGLAGGAGGNISLNRSILNRECGAAGRLSGIVPGLACFLPVFLDVPVIEIFPAPVLAGLLLFLGLSIVVSAVRWATPRRHWADLMLIALICGLVIGFGYLEALFVGLVGACLLFAYTYSRVDVVRSAMTRTQRASAVDRPVEQAAYLLENGQRIKIFELAGYLFFATSNRLVEGIRRGLPVPPAADFSAIIVDFRHVTGLDISAVLSFAKLRNACEEAGVRLALCGLSAENGDMMVEGRLGLAGDRAVVRFGTLDEAIEWAEEALLEEAGGLSPDAHGFAAWLCQVFGAATIDAQILPYMERLDFRPGERLVAQGAPSDSIDLVAGGRVRVVFERPDGTQIRLRSMLGHTVLGEMGFYRGTPRTASVLAEQPTVVYRLSRAAYEAMARDNPQALADFNRFIISVLADRLTLANCEIAIREA